MGKLEKSFYLLCFFLVIFIVAGFKVVPAVLKEQLIKNLDENLTTKTTIEKIEFNPFTLNAKIYKFKLTNEDNSSDIYLDKLAIDFSLLKSIEKRHISFKNITLDGIYLNIIEEKDGTFNLSKIVKPREDKPKEETKTENSDIKFLISKIDLLNTNINFTTLVKNEPFTINLKDINYTIYDLGTYKNALSSNDLKFKLNEHTDVSIGGAFRLEPFNMYGKILINDLRIKELFNFKKEIFNFDINDNSNLNLVLNYSIDTANEFDLKLSSELLEVNDLKLTQNKTQIASLNKLDIKRFDFDLINQDIKLDGINFKDLNAKMVSDKNGINFANLTHQTKSKEIKKEEPKAEEKTTSKPWIVTLSNIDLNTNFNFDDKVNKTQIDAKSTTINLKNLKIIDSKVDLNSLSLKNPTLTYLDNTNKLDIKSKNTTINLDKLALENSILEISKIELSKGNLDLKEKNSNINLNTQNLNLIVDALKIEDSKTSINSINLRIPNTKVDDIKSKLNAKISNTNLDVKEFLLNNSDIKISAVNLTKTNFELDDKANNLKINANNLNLNISKLSNNKSGFKIEKTNLNNPNISVILGKNTNPKKDDKEVTKKATNSKESSSKTKLNIGPVNINNASFTFEDKNLPLPFKTTVSKLNGKISEVKSNKSSRTNLKVDGVVDKYGVAKITGIVDPNNIKILTDINMKFKNIAMQNFTPYTGKFIGRELKSGKLDLDLKYNIDKSNLDAKNNIVITKLELGKQIESPEAVSLPLEIAISLLENSKNVIDINLPVSGNVDDPQFSVGSIVWKAFVNLITKAVTAPFSLLGAVFNFSEDEIKSVNFDYLESDITPVQKETLDKIAQILTAKKNIAIKISASYDKNKELFALKEEKYLAKNKDDKKLSKEERDELISKEKVDDKKLELIAKNRVQNIKNYLLKEKSISNKQVILTEELEDSNSSINLKIEQVK